MAEPRPKVTARAAATTVTTSVPAISGRTPKRAGSKSGAQSVPVRKSQMLTSRKNSIAGKSRLTTMPTVVAIERRAKRARTPLMTSSPQRRRSARRRISVWVTASVATRLLLAPRQPDRAVVLVLRLRELTVGQRDVVARLRDRPLVRDHVADERLDRR